VTPTRVELHPLIEAAGREGVLPDWARCSPGRREHIRRVRELVDEWVGALGLPGRDRIRWRAAATLHDALRGAEEDELRRWTDVDWPPPLLHAPACAGRLRREGVADDELLHAIAYHPLGHPDLTDLGQYLYLADFLEPGREFLPEVRERLRSLLPDRKGEALRSVVALRLANRLEVRGAIRPETVSLWNRLVEGSAAEESGGEEGTREEDAGHEDAGREGAGHEDAGEDGAGRQTGGTTAGKGDG